MTWSLFYHDCVMLKHSQWRNPCAHFGTMNASVISTHAQAPRLTTQRSLVDSETASNWVNHIIGSVARASHGLEQQPDVDQTLAVLQRQPIILQTLRTVARTQNHQWDRPINRFVQRLLYATMHLQVPGSPMPDNGNPLLATLEVDSRVRRHSDEQDETWSTDADVGQDNEDFSQAQRSIIALVNALTPFAPRRGPRPIMEFIHISDGLIQVVNQLLNGPMSQCNRRYGGTPLQLELPRYGLAMQDIHNHAPGWVYRAPAQEAVDWYVLTMIFQRLNGLTGIPGRTFFQPPWEKCLNPECNRCRMTGWTHARIGDRFDNRSKTVLKAHDKKLRDFCCAGCLMDWASRKPNGPPRGDWRCGSRCEAGPCCRNGTNPKQRQWDNARASRDVHPYYIALAQEIVWGLTRVKAHESMIRFQRTLSALQLRTGLPVILLRDGHQQLVWESQPTTREPSEAGSDSAASTTLSRM